MHTDLKHLRVAVIHDWLNGMRGGEHVLDAILEIFPEAELFTLFYTPGKLNARIENRPIHSSFLNRIPFAAKFYRFFLPLFPLAIENFDLSRFDLVISSSHCVAKGVIPRPDALHICYSHTPMRYIWDQTQNYFKSSILRFFLAPVLHYLRVWDSSSNNRVDHFLANSRWVQARIKKYYGRDSFLLHPFLNSDLFSAGHGEKGNYYLVVSAFAPYKRIDLAIQACERLGRKLVVIGSGQDEKKLLTIAGPHTTFLGRASLETLQEMYAGAKALIFPGQEDFGIVPLESMASGTPVIAYGQGGATDTVVPEKTGLFFQEQTVESLCEAILEFESIKVDWKELCLLQANQFTKKTFQDKFTKFVGSAWKSHHSQAKLMEPELFT